MPRSATKATTPPAKRTRRATATSGATNQTTVADAKTAIGSVRFVFFVCPRFVVILLEFHSPSIFYAIFLGPPQKRAAAAVLAKQNPAPKVTAAATTPNATVRPSKPKAAPLSTTPRASRDGGKGNAKGRGSAKGNGNRKKAAGLTNQKSAQKGPATPTTPKVKKGKPSARKPKSKAAPLSTTPGASGDGGKGNAKGRGNRKTPANQKSTPQAKTGKPSDHKAKATFKSPAPGSPSSEDGGKGKGTGKGQRKKTTGSVENKSSQKRSATGRASKANTSTRKAKASSESSTPGSPSSAARGKGKETGKRNAAEPDDGGGRKRTKASGVAGVAVPVALFSSASPPRDGECHVKHLLSCDR